MKKVQVGKASGLLCSVLMPYVVLQGNLERREGPRKSKETGMLGSLEQALDGLARYFPQHSMDLWLVWPSLWAKCHYGHCFGMPNFHNSSQRRLFIFLGKVLPVR